MTSSMTASESARLPRRKDNRNVGKGMPQLSVVVVTASGEKRKPASYARPLVDVSLRNRPSASEHLELNHAFRVPSSVAPNVRPHRVQVRHELAELAVP